MEAMPLLRLLICLAAVSCLLGTVTTLSIQTPSASNAIVGLRVAHLEVSWAKIAFRDPAIHEAEFHLNEAWSALRHRRYEQSVFAASEALQRVRDIKGEVPSLYSSHWERKSAHVETRRNHNTVAQSGMNQQLSGLREMRVIYGKSTMAFDAD